MIRNSRGAAVASSLLLALLIVAVVHGQGPSSIPNGARFENPGGTLSTYSTSGSIDTTGPFFQNLGTNGRSCSTCHQLSDAMTVAAAHVQQRFDASGGLDPIFRTNDGSNCNHDVDVSSLEGRSSAYSLLRTRGLLRIAINVPANANFDVIHVDNPYACNETDVISMYRRPLPATNLRFLTTVMWDGRESSPLTGTTKIQFNNYPASLLNDLTHQAVDAINGHAQGDGTRPTPAELQQIVNFEAGLYSAQATAIAGGNLSAQGAAGGPLPLLTQPFFVSMNSSVNFLLPQFEQPGGLVTPGDGQFTSNIFNTFSAWSGLPYSDPRAAIARGQAIFNSKPINITGVAGINDDISQGGLVAGGIPVLEGTCGTCHDTPAAGNHSFPTSLNIGAGDPNPGNPSFSMGGLDISYLPRITVQSRVTGETKITTDLGQALIDGQFDHVGKVKGPILRGLSARAPYFHNGSAQTLLDVVRFYETRFGVVFTQQEESDLVAFLSAL